MKKLSLFIFVLFALLACDKVKNPIVSVPCESSIAPHVVKTNSLTMNFRKVLVEDYTGHTCGNCPRAAENIETMLGLFKDSIIPIAVHAGNQFAPPSAPDYPEDFRTSEGTEWDTYMGMSAAGLPKGCVNRSQLPFPQPRTTWSVTAGNLLNNPQEAKLLLTTTVDTNQLLMKVSVKTTFLKAFNYNVNLCVVVTQDSIVASQKDYTPPSGALVINSDERPDYVFDHMLRGSLNGAWGDLIKSSPIAVNDTVTKVYSCYRLNPWVEGTETPKSKLHHMSVVAFIFDPATKVIIQAEKVKIK